MSEKRFQKTRIVDKWGGIYDSKTDEVLDVNDVEHKLNEQQATINQQQFQLDMSQKVIKKLKNDIKMILNMTKEEQQELRCYFHIWCDMNE